MSEWMRGMGWLIAGVGLTMVTDGFGTFRRTPETPGEVPPDTTSELPGQKSPPSEPGPSGAQSGDNQDAPSTYNEESLRGLQRQIEQLERLLSERRVRGGQLTESQSETKQPGPAQQNPQAPQIGDLREQLLAQQDELLPGAEGLKVDAETQRQVMQIVKDLQRQMESGQLDRQRQLDEVMKSNP